MTTQYRYLASDICQIISDLRGEATINTDASRLRAIDRAAGDFSTRRYWKIYRLPLQSMSGTGVNSYTIGSTTYPMRLKGLTEVFVGGTTEDCRYQLVDEVKFRELYNCNNSEKLAYEWYDAASDDWKVYISPAPSASDTIYYTYYWQAPAVTSTNSLVFTPDPDIIARRALAYIYEGEDEDKFQIQFQLSEQMASEWDEKEDIPAINQQYSVAPPTNRGLGTY